VQKQGEIPNQIRHIQTDSKMGTLKGINNEKLDNASGMI
jgi:hypothetical protein